MGDGSAAPVRMKSHTSDLTQSTLNQERLARSSMSTEWTDEKRSLYLKSMEASFVDDLYNSFDFFGYQIEHSPDSKSSRRKQIASCSPSGQFKVLRRGYWEKINFERNRSQPDKLDEPTVLLANPWIRHFRSARGRQVAASADVSSYDSTEVTDQNFIEEEDIGEKAGHKSNAKRIKTSPLPTPSIDQVVPTANIDRSADVNDKSELWERGRQCNSGDLRINTESSV